MRPEWLVLALSTHAPPPAGQSNEPSAISAISAVKKLAVLCFLDNARYCF
jgi:hypothetical protein